MSEKENQISKENEELKVRLSKMEAALRSGMDKAVNPFMESFPIGVFWWNVDGVITDANDYYLRMIGYSREELDKGLINWKDLTPSEYSAKDKQALEEYLSAGKCYPYEKAYFRRDRSTFPIMVSSIEINSDTRTGIGFVFDLTDIRKNEEALQQRESMLEEAQRIANLGSWEYDIERQKVTWSKNLYRIFGQDPLKYQPTLENLFNQIHPDDREKVRGSIMHSINTRNEYENEYRILTPDEDTRIVQSKGQTLLDGQGNPVILMGTLIDITERKSAERQIQEQAFLINHVNDAVIAIDADLRIYFWNKGAEKIYGWSAEEVTGKTAPEVLQTFISDSTREEVLRIANESDGYKTEVIQKHKNGQDIHIESSFNAIKDENGKLLNYITVNRDITARKKMEEALLEGSKENEMLARIIELSSQPLGIGLLDGRMGLVNKAFESLTGYSREELANIDWSNALTPPEYHDLEHRLLEQVVRTGEPVRYEKEYIRKDGTHVPIELLVHIMKDQQGNPEFYFSFLTDITERKKTEQNLYKMIRTLRALQTSSQLMIHAKDEQQFLKDVCKVIVQDCGHQMVWIGYKQDDPGMTVKPIAFAGFEEHYLDMLQITWGDSDRGNGPTGRAIRSGKMQLCRNMLTDPAFEPWREEAIKRGYASSIVLPLLKDDLPFGAINIYSQEADSFSDDEQQLLLKLAEDLSYGITAIRLNHELKRSKEYLEIKVEERTALLQKTYDDLASEKKRFQDVLNMIPAYVALINPEYKLLFSNRIFVENFGKVNCEKCYEYHFGRSEPCQACPIREVLDFNQPVHREWKAPNGKIYQVSDFPFTESDGSRLILEMGMDITEKKNIENYVLSKILETEENDRRRFASDLHDDLGPTLSAIKLQLGILAGEENNEERNEIINICDQLLSEGIEKMRTLANYIMPSLIESYGLETALKSFVHKMEKTCQLTFNFNSNLEYYRFDTETELHLYRVVTELVNNTIKHSGATEVFLDLILTDNEFKILYSDNGRGYNIDWSPLASTGIGLQNIRNRVHLVQGTVEFNNKEGKTVVEIRKPVSNKIS